MKRIAFLAALAAALLLPSSAVAAGWTWPVRGDVVSKYSNGDDPYAGGQHRGIDIAAPAGARVGAAAGGRVRYVGVAGDSGLTVTVRTSDGRYDVSYLHLSRAAVREGDMVGGGDHLGAVGTTGRRSVGQPHLHFGVRDAGSRHVYHDPMDFLPPPTTRSPAPRPPVAVPVGRPLTAPPATVPARAPGPALTGQPAPGPATAPAGQPAHGPAAAPAPGPALGALGLGAAAPLSTSGGPRAQAPAVSHPAAVGRSAQGGGAPRTAGGDGQAARVGTAGRPAAAGPAGLGRAPGGARGPAASAPRRDAVAAVQDSRTAEPGTDRGIDLAWLAALVGLVAAALCLSQPDRSRRTAHRAARGGRVALGAVLRPLTSAGGRR
jgi:hypothetical protein